MRITIRNYVVLLFFVVASFVSYYDKDYLLFRDDWVILQERLSFTNEFYWLIRRVIKTIGSCLYGTFYVYSEKTQTRNEWLGI